MINVRKPISENMKHLLLNILVKHILQPHI